MGVSAPARTHGGMSTLTLRHPAGTGSGGRYAPHAHPEPPLALNPPARRLQMDREAAEASRLARAYTRRHEQLSLALLAAAVRDEQPDAAFVTITWSGAEEGFGPAASCTGTYNRKWQPLPEADLSGADEWAVALRPDTGCWQDYAVGHTAGTASAVLNLNEIQSTTPDPAPTLQEIS